MMSVLLAVSLLGAPQFITAQSGVRLRASAGADGKEITVLPIGVALTQVEAAGAPVTIDGKQGTWEHVKTSDGKDGFIFSSGLAAVDGSDSAKAYLDLWESRRKNKKLTFPERADLFKMLDRAITERGDAKYKQPTVDLELARFRALKAAVEMVGDRGNKPPFKGFLKEFEDVTVFSEPGGEWLVWSSKVLDRADGLQAHNLDTELLTWEVSQNPTPGECEGDMSCMLGRDNMTTGAYLKRYPAGAHVDGALKTFADYKANMEMYKELARDLDRQQYDDAIAEADTTIKLIEASNGKKKAQALATVKEIRAELVKAKKAAGTKSAEGGFDKAPQ